MAYGVNRMKMTKLVVSKNFTIRIAEKFDFRIKQKMYVITLNIFSGHDVVRLVGVPPKSTPFPSTIMALYHSTHFAEINQRLRDIWVGGETATGKSFPSFKMTI